MEATAANGRLPSPALNKARRNMRDSDDTFDGRLAAQREVRFSRARIWNQKKQNKQAQKCRLRTLLVSLDGSV